MSRIIQRLQRVEGLSLLEDGAGYVALLRLSPGAAIPLHRHSGETHLYNLSGSRQLHTGEIIGPHGYVQEPCGTVNSWKTWGDEPAEVLLMVRGRMSTWMRRAR